MATPARAPMLKDNWWRTPVLAGLIAILISLVTFSFNFVRVSVVDETTIQDLRIQMNTKVDKERYDTDIVWIKDTLKEMKVDVKEIKKERK